MIYTCTMNPAIDIFMAVDEFKPNIVNRSAGQNVLPNGKAVNISFVLKMLGFDSVATGFSAGFTGHFNEEELDKEGIRPDFVQVEGLTRLNVFIRVRSEDTEYKLVNPGPEIRPADMQALLDQMRGLGPDDILCISGSNPPGVPDDVYLQIARIAEERSFRLVLDSSHKSIPATGFCRPYLIKPNIDELAAWFGRPSLTRDEAVGLAKKMVDDGFRHVLVTLGEDGALYIDGSRALHANAPRADIVNTACAGDTTIATFLAGLLTDMPLEDNLRRAVAAGTSTAMRPGLTDFTDVGDLEKQIAVTDIR